MNLAIVLKTLSIFLISLSTVMLIPCFVALWYHEHQSWVFLISSLITLSFAGVLYIVFQNPKADKMFKKEGFAITGFGWLAASFFGGLPFALSGYLDIFQSFFETASGFTTTGATVLIHLDSFPKSLLLWRSLIQWLGGMGIIVLFVAIFPFLGTGGKLLFKSESSAGNHESIRPKIKETARRMWIVYLSLTCLEVLFLWAGPMTLFESVCHSLTTVATGGFSTLDASIAGFNSLYTELIIIVFMTLSGINFYVFYNLLFKKPLQTSAKSEVKIYLVLLFSTIAITTLLLWFSQYASFWTSLRHASFTITSLMTTTGFGTEDFNLWVPPVQWFLVLIMFIGGCAGSTSGGMKIIRFQIIAKFIKVQIEKAIYTGAVKTIRVGNDVIDENTKDDVLAFVGIAVFTIGFMTFFLTYLGLDLVSAMSAAVSCFWNVGPGLGSVGPAANYAHIPDIGLVILGLGMIMGRLEIFAVLVLWVPAFWKK